MKSVSQTGGHGKASRRKTKVELTTHGWVTRIVYTKNVEVSGLLKNITLSADARLIEKARLRAKQNNTTLNELFRQWLLKYTSEPEKVYELEEFIERVNYVRVGRRLSRDELNER